MNDHTAENDAPWTDGDAITRRRDGKTWTRRDGLWYAPDEDPKTDAHATATVKYFGGTPVVSVVRVTPPG